MTDESKESKDDGVRMKLLDLNDRTRGVKAIMFISKMAGEPESEESAEKFWDDLSTKEKMSALVLFTILEEANKMDQDASADG